MERMTMPMVEVWIDNEPCDGTCGASKEAENLDAQIQEAIMHLNMGDPESALAALGERCPHRKSPESIKGAYAIWKSGKLPGFTNYCAPEASQ